MNAQVRNRIALAAAITAVFVQLASSPFAVPTLAAPAPPEWQSVYGSGEVEQMPGVVYRNAIAASLGSDGQVSGTFEVNIFDLSGFGVPGKFKVLHRINCLAFDGDSVWFGAVAVESNLPGTVGTQAIGQIKRIGSVEYAFSGPAQFYIPPGTTCADKPTLPIAPVRNGNFTIQ